MYGIVLSSRAKRALRKYRRSGTFPVKKYDQAIECLRKGEAPPRNFEDHALSGEMASFREFHIAADLLVQYERDDDLLVVTIIKVGTHAELFGS